jgi:hypothetical protein
MAHGLVAPSEWSSIKQSSKLRSARGLGRQKMNAGILGTNRQILEEEMMGPVEIPFLQGPFRVTSHLIGVMMLHGNQAAITQAA